MCVILSIIVTNKIACFWPIKSSNSLTDWLSAKVIDATIPNANACSILKDYLHCLLSEGINIGFGKERVAAISIISIDCFAAPPPNCTVLLLHFAHWNTQPALYYISIARYSYCTAVALNFHCTMCCTPIGLFCTALHWTLYCTSIALYCYRT